MKKFFIGLFIAFVSIISINTIKADELQDSGIYEYLTTYHYRQPCNWESEYWFSYYESSSNHSYIYVYEVTSESITFHKTNNVNTVLLSFVSDLDVTSSLVAGRNYVFNNSHLADYKNLSLNEGDFVSYTNPYYPNPMYLYLYTGHLGTVTYSLGTEVGVVVNLNPNSGSGSESGSGSSGSGSESNEIDSEVPVAEISDSDYFLFFDFDTISDFDIFSDYSFTGFTDYEKLMFTLVINIFYLGFIGFCIYIVLKGLNKMFSWVFR